MNAIQFDFHFDHEKIHQELKAIANSFSAIHSIRIENGNLNGIHLITPRPNGEKDENGFSFDHSPELAQSPYLQSILNTFPCDKFIFRVHNLKAKGKINLHRDTDRGLLHNIVRIHIPVTTNPEVYFYVNGERIIMQNGECWFADISQLHEVENRSETDRLQLLIDCDMNDWWKAVLKEKGMDVDRLSVWKKHSLEELQLMKENFVAMGIADNQEVIERIDLEIMAKEKV